jgi:hypothetical protein
MDPRSHIALGLILLGAATLRLAAVGLGHPFLSFQPDEEGHALQALRFAHGKVNPFYYPALLLVSPGRGQSARLPGRTRARAVPHLG